MIHNLLDIYIYRYDDILYGYDDILMDITISYLNGYYYIY